ncbi:MAG TPA: MerR family transcriptional regulator [Caulobacteraceae bacterium]|jgi:DNA-binding transcriptional MerR regulator
MLKIGDFSRLGRVTVKALRHYDKAGLLRPKHVDDWAGYRYYGAEQLETLNRILLLKDLGFTLKDISGLLREPTGLPEAIERRRSELAASIDSDVERLRRLDVLREARSDEAPPPPVLLRVIEPTPALTARELVSPGDGRATKLFEALEAQAARARARADSSPFLLFHDCSREDRLDIEACIPLSLSGSNLPGARIVEGHRRAGSLVYRGPYSKTPSLFAALGNWIEANGGTLTGPTREVYHRFGADQRGYRLPAGVLADRPQDYVTELQAPVAMEDAA